MSNPRHIAALVLLLACMCALRVALTLGETRAAPAASGDPTSTGDVPSALAADVDQPLTSALRVHGFTGRVEQSLERRLGRPVDAKLAELGRLLWFDTITGLNDDNSCGGCHSPTNGFGDTQAIAIGIENNNLVGPNRTGPRNQRRSPLVINTAFYPALMWNSRFASLSQDPFDHSAGFVFPPPEGLTLSYQPHLLVAQAFIPPTERNEVAGFEFVGDNFAIRAEVLNRLNAIPEYRRLFGRIFPEVRNGAPITFDHFGQAIAEFEFTLVFTNAPLDRFARGETSAMSDAEKRGALVFFGAGGCVQCHTVSGSSNEMFSDFRMHVIGVPQIAPKETNSVFDGADANEDFGLEQVTGNRDDRYMFRTAPLRNLAVSSGFMHNGCFLTLEEAVRHHLDVFASARSYSPQNLDEDLQGPVGPIEPVLRRVDPLLSEPIPLSQGQFQDLVQFLRTGLLDPRARFENLSSLIPKRVPSGRPTMIFEAPPATAAGAGGVRAAEAFARVEEVELSRPHPNPSSGDVSLALSLPQAGPVRAEVVDLAGRVVRTLEPGSWRSAGTVMLRWDGADATGRPVRNGVYFVRARVGQALLRQSVVRVR